MSASFSQLRKQNRIKLSGLDSQLLSLSSKVITAKVINSKEFAQSSNIACYIPFEHKVDVWPVIKEIWRNGKNCYLPAIEAGIKKELFYIKFLPNDELNQGKYKTLEPKISADKTILAKDLDLVIVPLIGFNQKGFRLGRGKGYYDYTFAFKKRVLFFKNRILSVWLISVR